MTDIASLSPADLATMTKDTFYHDKDIALVAATLTLSEDPENPAKLDVTVARVITLLRSALSARTKKTKTSPYIMAVVLGTMLRALSSADMRARDVITSTDALDAAAVQLLTPAPSPTGEQIILATLVSQDTNTLLSTIVSLLESGPKANQENPTAAQARAWNKAMILLAWLYRDLAGR